MKIWNYIVGAHFFPKYAPKVKNFKAKMSRKNSKGNPITFSEQDVTQIQKGIDKMYKDLKKGEP